MNFSPPKPSTAIAEPEGLRLTEEFGAPSPALVREGHAPAVEVRP